LILVACGNDEVNVDYDEIINAVTISDIDLGSITDDFVLPDKMDGYNLVWISNNEAISNGKAIVTRNDDDASVTLTASFVFNGKVETKEFTITVLKEEIDEPEVPVEPTIETTYFETFEA